MKSLNPRLKIPSQFFSPQSEGRLVAKTWRPLCRLLLALLVVSSPGRLHAQAPGPMMIANPSFQGDSFTFSFSTYTNQTYMVQCTAASSPSGPWVSLVAIDGDGMVKTVTDVAGGVQGRIYRLVAGLGPGPGNVYSLNAVGFVRRVLEPGTNLLANPLCTTNYTIGALLPNCPDGSRIFKDYGYSSEYIFGGWDSPDLTLYPGEGAIFVNPSPSSAFEVVFVGEVPYGSLTNQVPAGMSLRSSRALVTGLLEFPARDGDIILTWDTSSHGFIMHQFWEWDGTWDIPPTTRPGEAFWVMLSQPVTWVQNVDWETGGGGGGTTLYSQPASRTNYVGTTATFTVGATSPWPLAYQWRFHGTNLTDGGNISGATTSTLTVSNVVEADAGGYYAVVTSTADSVASGIATLTVLQAGPSDADSIRALFGSLKSRAEAHDLAGFMALFAPGYLHSGTDHATLSANMQQGLPAIQSFDSAIDQITVTGTNATVHATCTVTFNNGQPSLSWTEPDTANEGLGLGWLAKSASGWQVIGNQQKATVQVQTEHHIGQAGDSYLIRLRAESSLSITAVTVTGPDLTTTSLQYDSSWDSYVGFIMPIGLPPVGTGYQFDVWFADGTRQVLNDTLKSWVPTGPAVSVTTTGGLATIHWTDVSGSVPNAAYYWVWVEGNGVSWVSEELPLPRTSIAFNEDGGATGSLQDGKLYSVSVFIFDSSSDYCEVVSEFTMGSGQVQAPVITAHPQSRTNLAGTSAAFSVSVTGTEPLSYQWIFNDANLVDGGNIFGATTTNLTIASVQPANAGFYRVAVSNASGSVTSADAQLTVAANPPDSGGSEVVAWGENWNGQTKVPVGLSNIVAVAAGGVHCLALREGGTVGAWGGPYDGATNVPAGLANVVAVAAGWTHSLALRQDGTVTAWGEQVVGEGDVLAGLSNVAAVAAGGFHFLALRADGTVVAWGDNSSGQTNVPPGLSNVVAVGGGIYHSLALRANGTMVAWGQYLTGNGPQVPATVPEGLSNVVAIGCGMSHNLALTADGTVTAWGLNIWGQTNVPAGLSNVIAVAGGGDYSLALRNDGTISAWGDNTVGQTSFPQGLSNVVAISASRIIAPGSGRFGLALTRLVQPRIQRQPFGPTVDAGTTAWLSVEAAGTPPLSYQWRLNGTNLMDGANLSGATGSVLAVANAQAANEGSYSVFVTNAYGGVTSQVALLTVRSTTPNLFSLLEYYYPVSLGNQWVYDSSQGSSSWTTVCQIAAVDLPLTCYTGRNPVSTYTRPVNSVLFDQGDSSWTNYMAAGSGSWGYVGSDHDGGQPRMRFDAGFVFTNQMFLGQTLSQTNDIYADGVYSGQGTALFHLIDLADVSVPGGSFAGCLHLEINIAIGSRTTVDEMWWARGTGPVKWTHGQPGAPSVEVNELRAASYVNPPRITVPPQSQTLVFGSTVSLSVEATGDLPLSYRWRRNGADLADGGRFSGVTTTNLLITNLQPGDTASYSVVVGNTAGSVESDIATLTVLAPCVSVSSDQPYYPMAGTLALRVQSFDCATSSPIPNVAAVVRINTAGTTRTNYATTDATGQATVYFEPLAGETGHYEISASLLGQPAPSPQGSFAIVGVGFTTNQLAHRLIVGQPTTNTIELRNLTDVPLSGLTASLINPPPDVTFQATTSDTLPARGTNTLTYVLKATAGGADPVSLLRVTSAEGATNDLPVTIEIAPPVPQLVVTPSSLSAAMLRGSQSIATFKVANVGGASSGDLDVLVPNDPSASWLGLVTPPVIPALAPNEQAEVAISLTPSNSLPLGPYGGAVSLWSADAGQTDIPFQFQCVSTLKGNLRVTVVDEFTYYAVGAPKVTNATVTLFDPYVRTNIVSTATDADGIALFTDLTEAYYGVTVTAPNHGSFTTIALVSANKTFNLTAFLARQMVSYQWIVTTQAITDRYLFTLGVRFETEVPAPVVRVEPGAIDLCQYPDDTNVVNLTIYNSGLITAKAARLFFATHPRFEITPLTGYLGDIPGQSSRVVPVIVRRLPGIVDGPSSIEARLDWELPIGDSTSLRHVPIYIFNACLHCCDSGSPGSVPDSPPTPWLGGSWGDGLNGRGGPVIFPDSPTGSLPRYPSVTYPPMFPPVVEPPIPVSVGVRLSQSAVLTRQAFEAFLALTNGCLDALTDLGVVLNIRDRNGEPANDRFGIRPPVLGGLNAVDGTGTLAPLASGTARWAIIPAADAAPSGPARYTVGGQINFRENGANVLIPLFDVPITVYPDARLVVDYFWEREVFGDDPFTADVEPAVPFAVGLRMKNAGLGNARDVRVTSAQPQIVDNTSGLLVEFQLLSSQVGVETATPSFTASLGDITAGSNAVALWWMTASLQGRFTNYSATFAHLDDLGNGNLSLVQSISNHPLVHVVRADRPTDDLVPDFLVSDNYFINPLPDRLYLSDGSEANVTAITSGTIDGPLSPSHTNVLLTASVPPGWVYLRIADPGRGSTPSFVRRSDGGFLLVGQNVWTTHRMVYPLNGDPPYAANFLHILDFDSTGSYTIGYRVALFIVQQPQSRTNLFGTTATFTVRAGGTDPIGYQWLNNGAILPGQTDAALTITNVQLADAGDYSVVVTNLAGPLTSDLATLTVCAPPVITGQPQSLTNNLGTTVSFTVQADGTPSPTYQWLKGNEILVDSGRISGATTTTLTVSDVQAGDVADYSVIVANDYGALRSMSARLYVAVTANDPVAGLVAYYPLNGDARDASGNGNHGAMFGVVPAADRFGAAAGSCYFSGDATYITAAADHLPSSNRTVSVWFKADRVDSRPGLLGYGGSGVGDSFFLGLNHWGSNSFVLASHYWNYILQAPYAAPPVDRWYHWVTVMDDMGSRFYLDGAMIGSRTGTTQTYVRGTSLALGTIPNTFGVAPYTDANVGFFTGSLDEVRIYDRPLSEVEILALYWLGANGQAPVIVSEPQDRTNLVGTVATFSVAAAGTPPLSYQWRFNAVPLDGATAATFTIPNVQVADAGLYSAIISNAGGSVSTRGARLAVVPAAPRICPVADQFAVVGRLLVITNCTENMAAPVTFSLGLSAPAGASLTPDGILSWTPQCDQGGTTNQITIRAADSGSPAVSNSITFAATVLECIETHLGNGAVLAGATNSVSLRLLSALPLTNLAFNVVYPADRLTNFTIAVNTAGAVSQNVAYPRPGEAQVSFTVSAAGALPGPADIGQVGFTAVSGQSSAFVPVVISNVTALTLDGRTAANASGLPGRLVVIGQQPVLEAGPGTNGHRRLTLYGNPDYGHALEWKTSLSDAAWQAGPGVSLTNLSQTIDIPNNGPASFYRAYRQ